MSATLEQAEAVVIEIPTFDLGRWRSVRPATIEGRTGLPRSVVDEVLEFVRQTGFAYSSGGHYQIKSAKRRDLLESALAGRFR